MRENVEEPIDVVDLGWFWERFKSGIIGRDQDERREIEMEMEDSDSEDDDPLVMKIIGLSFGFILVFALRAHRHRARRGRALHRPFRFSHFSLANCSLPDFEPSQHRRPILPIRKPTTSFVKSQNGSSLASFNLRDG